MDLQIDQQPNYIDMIYLRFYDQYSYNNFFYLFDESKVSAVDSQVDKKAHSNFTVTSIQKKTKSQSQDDTEHHISMDQNFNLKKSQNLQKQQYCQNLPKQKKIPKSHKKEKKKAFTQKKQNTSQKSSQSGKNSRFNNMGAFLIGSLSEILAKSDHFEFSNDQYYFTVSGKLVMLTRSNLKNDNALKILKKLKKDIRDLPRKQGAKKHLFRLINQNLKDNYEKKECKRLIREELLYYLGQDEWLKNHSDSRSFQPQGDDAYGSKKKERHQAYLEYLTAIRHALRTKGSLPKRLNP